MSKKLEKYINIEENKRIMGIKKIIYVVLLIIFIICAIVSYVKYGNGNYTAIFIGLAFLITFFKSQFYDLLSEIGL